MATIVPYTYKDDQGIVRTMNVDIDYESHYGDIPDEAEHSIKMTNQSEQSEVTDFIGVSPKR